MLPEIGLHPVVEIDPQHLGRVNTMIDDPAVGVVLVVIVVGAVVMDIAAVARAGPFPPIAASNLQVRPDQEELLDPAIRLPHQEHGPRLHGAPPVGLGQDDFPLAAGQGDLLVPDARHVLDLRAGLRLMRSWACKVDATAAIASGTPNAAASPFAASLPWIIAPPSRLPRPGWCRAVASNSRVTWKAPPVRPGFGELPQTRRMDCSIKRATRPSGYPCLACRDDDMRNGRMSKPGIEAGGLAGTFAVPEGVYSARRAHRPSGTKP